MAVEGAIILFLLLVLLLVVVWAFRLKKGQAKNVGLIARVHDDDYSKPPGSSLE